MQPPRRKTPLLFSETLASMKHYGGGGGGRKNANLPVFVVVFSIFLFGCFIYNEDVKTIAEFPFSSSDAPKDQETKDIKSSDDSPVQESSGGGEDARSLPVQENNIDADEERSLPVVKTARTIVETEVEGRSYSTDRDHLQAILPLTLKSSVGKEEDEEEEERKEERKEEEEDEEDSEDDDKEREAKKKSDQSAMAGDQEEEDDEEDVELPPESCDLFTGEWVFDNSSHPLYREDQCEFLTAQVTCLRNGRKDSLYQFWKWQPRDCSLPKFV